MDKRQRRRKTVQALGALVFNGHLQGFVQGKIYSGPGKAVCVPVLNCYSCPGAVGACPIGSLQAVLGSPTRQFAYYVVGMLALFGIVLGRWICGFLCPFGLLQEILHKIPIVKVKVSKQANRVFSKLKYLVLAGVVLLPLYVTDAFGFGSPYFCKYLCPAGLIEGGLPLMALNPSLRALQGPIFWTKVGVTVVIIVGVIFIYRFFCRYLCPLGAFYGLCHRISLYRMEVSKECIECGRCVGACPMDVEVYQEPNSAECIRCGRCVSACPVDALKMGFSHKEVEVSDHEEI